jgi:hypothetical protein
MPHFPDQCVLNKNWQFPKCFLLGWKYSDKEVILIQCDWKRMRTSWIWRLVNNLSCWWQVVTAKIKSDMIMGVSSGELEILAALAFWLPQFNLLLTRTPRSFWFSTTVMSRFPRWYNFFGLLKPRCMTQHLSGFKGTHHWSLHSLTEFKSICSLLISVHSLDELNIFTSLRKLQKDIVIWQASQMCKEWTIADQAPSPAAPHFYSISKNLGF